ncbi:MAG: Rab family GTPase, partial [Promethearchaeota archaeon]
EKNIMDEEEFAKDFIFKICVIGDGATGKTSLITRFTQGSFNKDYIKTLGAQFSRFEKKFEPKNGEAIRARLFFWDIAGQSEFKFMRPTFYNGARAVIVVYDLTRPETLENINTWIEDISTYCGELPIVCFANKEDLINENEYDKHRIDEISKKYKFLKTYFTSAKTGKSVTDSFGYIIDFLIKDALNSNNE